MVRPTHLLCRPGSANEELLRGSEGGGDGEVGGPAEALGAVALGRHEALAVLGAPARGKQVPRVRSLPEVMAVPVTIEVESQAVAHHLHHPDHAEERRVLGVHRLELHPHLVSRCEGGHQVPGQVKLTVPGSREPPAEGGRGEQELPWLRPSPGMPATRIHAWKMLTGKMDCWPFCESWKS